MSIDLTFEGTIILVTAKAIKFQGNYWDGWLWLPQSQIEVIPDDGMSVVVKVRKWLAGKKGLEEFTEYTRGQIEQINGEM